MEICDINHLHRRFLDIWEWCMRQGFDTRAFTYVENAFKSEPTAELADRKTEPQYDAEEVAKDINRRVDTVKKEWNARHMDEPQTDCSWK